jgi:hypothetical protein
MDGAASGGRRVWSWARSMVEADARRREARELVGETVQAVHYYTLDYRRHELRPDLIDAGPRTVDDPWEWNAPTWRHEGFDALDYGLQITTGSGVEFSLTWDPPGDREGIGLQPVPMLGTAVRADADVAIWDVGDRAAPWVPMIGERLLGVDLHYVPWNEERGSLWCPRITIHGPAGHVDVVMGDSDGGALVPSADNVAVLHPGQPLPDWSSLPS